MRFVPTRATIWLPALLALAISPAFSAASSSDLPVLTTARSAHGLATAEAARAYPVKLRAIVTYYDLHLDPIRPVFFVADQSGSIYVALSALPSVTLRAGDLVEVTGTSGPGDFAPIVDHASARLLGHSRLPATAPRVGIGQLFSATEDGQWVEIDGVVRSLVEYGENVVLTLALTDGTICATTVREPGIDYTRLVDARVRIRGNAGPDYNSRHQMTGAHILFPGMSTLVVEEPAPANSFASPVDPADSLLRYAPDESFRHRVHLRGPVTLFWPGRVLCIQDGSLGLCAQTSQASPLNTGQIADVLGFPSPGDYTPELKDAVYKAASGRAETRPMPVTATEASSGKHDSQLVEIEGQLLGKDRAAQDPSIVLSSGSFIFSVVLPSGVLPEVMPGLAMPGAAPQTQTAPVWEPGSWLKVTGICSVQSASDGVNSARKGFSAARSFRIMLRSSADVVVLRKASWWTAPHALIVLAFAMAGILLTAAALFLQVRKARIIAVELRHEMAERHRAEEATRAALRQMEHQAHHDPLTGLANRLMFDTVIREALDLAVKSGGCVGLVCLDLDHFKAINDSLGHGAGDILLREAARRLTSVAPHGSLLARLGGDEFALLLPRISGQAEAEAAASRVVETLTAAFMIEGLPWHCPASAGLSLFPDDAQDVSTLQKNADTALYRAKRTFRGQVFTFDRLMKERVDRLRLIEKSLRCALESGGLSLLYQPRFQAQGVLYGFEATLRLRDRMLGAVEPAEYISVAEEVGLICELGEWALREACRQWVAWKSRGASALSVAVSVSPVQLTRGDFPAVLRKILAETAMSPEWLVLELTQSGILANTGQDLKALSAMGVRIAERVETGRELLSSPLSGEEAESFLRNHGHARAALSESILAAL